jgi:hypothetical protein
MNRLAREFASLSSGRVRHPELDDPALFTEHLLRFSQKEFDEVAAVLLFLVQNPAARDAVLLQWATDLDTGDRLWRFDEPELVHDLRFGRGPRPDPGRLERAIAVVERLLWLSEAQHARFMLAWLQWARSSWPS